MNILGIFVKHPVAGRVKTRLAAEFGDARAAELYAAFIADVADRFRDTADRRFLCYAPGEDSAHDYFCRIGGDDYDVWPQPDRSLGERLAAFFDDSFAAGAQRVVVVGSDSPSLPREFVEEAFRLLRNHDCILGPATDGGYYLIGQCGPSRSLFESVEWSSARVLEQTVANIAKSGARLTLLPPWYDVDTLDDLYLLRGHVRALQRAGEPLDLVKTEPLLGWDTVNRPGSV